MRPLLTGLAVCLFYLPMRQKIRWKQNWPIYWISALVNAILYIGLQTFGMVYLSGGVTSILVFLQPVLVGLFAWMWLGETMSVVKLIGLLFGFMGILVISLEGLRGHLSILGIVIGILAALAWALGTVYVKKVSGRVDFIWLIGFHYLIGGGFLTLGGLSMESYADIVWNGAYLLGLLFGGLLGLGAANIIYFYLVNLGEATKVASVTFLVPLLAVVIDVWLGNETVTASLFTGLAMIMISIFLVNMKKAARSIHVVEVGQKR